MVTSPYHVRFAPAAVRHIHDLPEKQQKLVLKLAEALAVNPRPPGANKIEGMAGLYSESVGDLRMVYKIEDQVILLLLVK